MTVPNFSRTPLTQFIPHNLIKYSRYLTYVGIVAIATSAQANTNSPYVALYKDQVNTNTQTIQPTTQAPQTHTIKSSYNTADTLPQNQNINLLSGQLSQIPTPQLSFNNITYVPTIIIAQNQSGTGKLDVSLLDDFITEINPHARHYPPNFNNVSQRYYSKLKLQQLEEWLRPYAEAPNASYDVLLRATKLNTIARNLDLGSDYAVRASLYVSKALRQQPNSAEANFLYGMMLSEGGAFKEGKKYLDKAAELGYTEAEQSLAQAELLSDRRSAALTRLRNLQRQMPDNQQIQQQIAIIESGKYYIWDIPTNTK